MRPIEGCNNNSTMYIMKTGSEGQSWLELAQNIQRWVLSVAPKLWNFLCIHRSKYFYHNAIFILSAHFLVFQVT